MKKRGMSEEIYLKIQGRHCEEVRHRHADEAICSQWRPV